MIVLQESYADIMTAYPESVKKNTTRNIMSKYEKTKVIGLRLEQLARGALATAEGANIRDIALNELEQRTLPFLIVRVLPNGIKEYWRLEDMIIV